MTPAHARAELEGGEVASGNALHDRDERLRDMFEYSGIGMALVAPDGRWIAVNPALCRIVGYSEPELLALTFQDITHPDDLDADLEHVRQMLAGEIETYQMEKRYLHKRGDVLWVRLSVTLVRDRIGWPRYFISQIEDITDRKRAEAELTRQALLFDTISDGVIVMDLSGRITDWNAGAERMFGYLKADVLGQDVQLIHHPDLGGALEREIRASLVDKGRWSGELPFLRKDGITGVADVQVVAHRDRSGCPTSWIGVNRDITDRRRSEEALRNREEQLRVSQRLEAVGQLAGGVAHDFNNILTAIKSYSELVLDDLGPTAPQRPDIEEIGKAADRASALTRQLLAFSRRQMLQPKVFDLNATVSDLERMLRRLLVEDIRLVTRLDARLGCVRADPGQIEQVLLNLVVNARDAMAEGGVLTIVTGNVEVDDAAARRRPGILLQPGRYVRLAVIDTGTGMDDATRARIFEPFFTTKPKGEGTGLGLATVYGIVQQSGGYVSCSSKPGEGATFEVYLPRVDTPADEVCDGGACAMASRGTETVLVVEDDDTVRAVVNRILTANGYTILTAANGAEALRICSASGDRIHLVISDIVMPEMGGPELARHLAVEYPELRVLFMSGYTEDAALRQSFLAPGDAFLEKPFAVDSLLEKVRGVLDGPRAPSGMAA